MRATVAWPQLLKAIQKHSKGVRRVLAVHTSTCSQPKKEPALVPSLDAAGLRRDRISGPGVWKVSLDLPALCAPGDRALFHITVEGPTKNKVVREACQTCLAFLLVVAPRKIVFHMNSLVRGVASKEALIAAGLAAQAEMGTPQEGTRRHLFHGD